MKHPTYNQEKMQHEVDGIPFNGHFIEWKMEYLPKTYLKESELSGDEWRKGGNAKIYMNGDCVFNEFCREPERALMILGGGLHQLQCFFEMMGIPDLLTWKENIIGKKVFHGCIPSTVERYCGNGEIILRRDDGKRYGPDLYPSLEKEEWHTDEWMDRDRVHMTDKRINWSI